MERGFDFFGTLINFFEEILVDFCKNEMIFLTDLVEKYLCEDREDYFLVWGDLCLVLKYVTDEDVLEFLEHQLRQKFILGF
jgi:hypothetical protein